MILPRLIPVLLLRGRGLVKGIGFKKHKYVGDPLNAVKIFNTKEVDELVFLDIDATRENRTIDVDLVERIADECYMPFSVGGGIRNINQIKRLLHAGAEKVNINSQAATDSDLVRQAAEEFGNQSIIVSIDAKKNWRGKYAVYSHSGKKKTRRSLVAYTQELERMGAGEILINSIDQDGRRQGYDLDLIRLVSENVNIPVICCGGAGELAHMQQAIGSSGASAVAAGSMFVFHGRKRAVLINYPSDKDRRKLTEHFVSPEGVYA